MQPERKMNKKIPVMLAVTGTKKTLTIQPSAFCRGLFQIRTGVDGFADRCLATRPRDQNGDKNILFF